MLSTDFIFGCWRLKEWGYTTSELSSLIYSALDAGVEIFDHADIYGDYSCEELFGDVLRANPTLRKMIKLSSKCGIKLPSAKFPGQTHIYDTSFKHIVAAVERSLCNLATDHLDLLLIHRPDPLMRADEVANAFEYLLNQGKVLNFGVSNFNPVQMDLLQAYLPFRLQTNQIEASVLCHENFLNGNFDYLQMNDIRPQIWSPLAGGRIFKPSTQQEIEVVKCLTEIADKYDTSIENIALTWLLMLPARPQIVFGSGKKERILSMLESKKIELTRAEWFAIWTACQGYDIP